MCTLERVQKRANVGIKKLICQSSQLFGRTTLNTAQLLRFTWLQRKLNNRNLWKDME